MTYQRKDPEKILATRERRGAFPGLDDLPAGESNSEFIEANWDIPGRMLTIPPWEIEWNPEKARLSLKRKSKYEKFRRKERARKPKGPKSYFRSKKLRKRIIWLGWLGHVVGS